MAESRKVGRVHAHKLPEADKVATHDIYRCECNREFFVEAAKNSLDKKWFPLDASPHLVEYDEAETDAPRIGRWTPPVENQEAEQDGESTSGENDRGVAGQGNEQRPSSPGSPEGTV